MTAVHGAARTLHGGSPTRLLAAAARPTRKETSAPPSHARADGAQASSGLGPLAEARILEELSSDEDSDTAVALARQASIPMTMRHKQANI